MRTIYLVIATLFVGLFTKAQQSDLINNTWYLHKMIISSTGEEVLAPNNVEVSSIKANFGEKLMTTTVVNQFGAWTFPGPHIAFTDTTILYDEFAYSTNSCQIPENCTFENNYFNVFKGGLSGIPIDYTIINEDNYLKLTLTNNNGNRTIYYAQNLAVNDSKRNKNKIYPNPVKDDFMIDTNDQIEQVEFYSINGQLIKAVKSKKINISNLPKGNYLVKIKTNKEIITQKIVKE